MGKIVFFRNDDVRNTLDESLIRITNTFIKHKVPICHAVEPGNISPEVIEWLRDLKNNYPDLIEIVQHGYKHNLNVKKVIRGRLKKGEFGGKRKYEEQFKDVLKGKLLMNEHFGESWFELFTYPYGARNRLSIKAVDDNQFKAVNGSMIPNIKFRLFSFVGRFLKREMLLNRKISWNLRYKPGTNLFQIDTGISLIKKFVDENDDAVFDTLDNIMIMTKRHLDTYPNLGFVLHHRYHKTEEHFKIIDELLINLKKINNIQFMTQQEIYNYYAR